MRKIAALLRHRQTPPPAQPSLAILAILAILASWRPGVLASWRPGVLASWRAKKDLRPRRHPPEADAKNPRWAEILLQISDLAEGVIHALRVRWPQSAARTNPNLRRVEANATARNLLFAGLLGICFLRGAPEDVVVEIGEGEKGG